VACGNSLAGGKYNIVPATSPRFFMENTMLGRQLYTLTLVWGNDTFYFSLFHADTRAL